VVAGPRSSAGLDAPSTRTGRPVVLGSLVLTLAGLGVSAYLTYEHLTQGATLACPDTGVINCVKVTSSAYSALLGVPVAVLGLIFFAVMTTLCLPSAWRSARAWLHGTRLAAAAAGVVFVLYLVWAELYRIDAICLWCTVVHLITLALFALLAFSYAAQPPGQ
jgi:uncharacterized membrane protein